MKQLISIIIVMTATQAWSLSQKFKVQAPIKWKLQEKADDALIYKVNNESQDTVVLRVQKLEYSRPLETLRSDLKLISDARAETLRQFNIKNYGILSYREQKIKDKKFKQYSELTARYLSVSGKVAQSMERQYFYDGYMYQVTYTYESPTAKDKRAREVLNFFKPLVRAGRGVASTEDLAGSTEFNGPVNMNGDLVAAVEPEWDPENMTQAQVNSQCSSVPEKERIVAGEKDRLKWGPISWLQACGTNLKNFVKSIASFVTNEGGARDQTIAAMGTFLGELRKSPGKVMAKLVVDMAKSFGNDFKQMTNKCLKPYERAKKQCQFLVDSAQLVISLVTGVGLAAYGVKKVVKTIVKSGGKGKPKLSKKEKQRLQEKAERERSDRDQRKTLDKLQADADKRNGVTAKQRLDAEASEIAFKQSNAIKELLPANSKALNSPFVNNRVEVRLKAYKDFGKLKMNSRAWDVTSTARIKQHLKVISEKLKQADGNFPSGTQALKVKQAGVSAVYSFIKRNGLNGKGLDALRGESKGSIIRIMTEAKAIGMNAEFKFFKDYLKSK